MQESQAWLIPPIDQQLVMLANQAEVQAVGETPAEMLAYARRITQEVAEQLLDLARVYEDGELSGQLMDMWLHLERVMKRLVALSTREVERAGEGAGGE